MKEYFEPDFDKFYKIYSNYLSCQLLKEKMLIEARKQRKILFVATSISIFAVSLTIFNKFEYDFLFWIFIAVEFVIIILLIIKLLSNIEEDALKIEIIKHIINYRNKKF